MCKENALVIAVGNAAVSNNKKDNAKGNYAIMRKGKTRRDHEGGAWLSRLKNRTAKAQENKAFHGKK